MAETGFLAGEEIDMSEQRSYPRHVKTDAGDIEIRLMSPAEFGTFMRAENVRWVKVVKEAGIQPQ